MKKWFNNRELVWKCFLMFIFIVGGIFWHNAARNEKINLVAAAEANSKLTAQEKTCEKITPQNQAHCTGPEQKKVQENCEKYYLKSIELYNRAEKGDYGLYPAAAANGIMFQNCQAHQKR